jgi:cytoskeleton protein RodZ
MTDGTEAPPRTTAGALLRAAREKQGLHIAALAAAIKVTPRKLDALENDRYHELPDPAFTRALAQTVCRSLKIDAQPVLALLPHADPAALDNVGGSLSTPFRDRPGRGEPAGLAVAAIRPMVWAGLALLLAAIAIYFVPSSLWQVEPSPAPQAAAPVAEPAASAVSASAAASSAEPAAAVVAATEPAASALPGGVTSSVQGSPASAASVPRLETVFSSSLPPAASGAAAPVPATLVQLRTDEPSWIEVRDARGQVLLSRTVQPGESVGFDGALPIRLTIGNAPATRVTFRGRPVDLAPVTRETVARLELQ